MGDKFSATRAAMAKYDKHQATYENFMSLIMRANNTDSQKLADNWFGEEARLKLMVGKAFVEATSDINGADKAHFVDVDWAREQVAYVSNPDRPYGEQREAYVQWVLNRHRFEGWPQDEERVRAKFDRIHGRGE